MDYEKQALQCHTHWKGKIEISPKMKIQTQQELSLAYTPGVAQPCLEIQKDPQKSYELTGRWNMVAVVTDGTAVLGLGDIGPEASMPVMEGKCVLFKTFGGVDAVPLCIRSKDTDEIVNTIALLAGSFGGINLEDISAPRCFEIEQKLKQRCDIPVFHDDQHGTAVVALAALMNAVKVVKKNIQHISVVIVGAGAAGIAIAKLLLAIGVKHLIICDQFGAIYPGRDSLNVAQKELAALTNPYHQKGGLEEVVKGMDVCIGVSVAGVISAKMVKSMGEKPVIFAMANPTPEIMPDEAKQAGAEIVGTGRSDFSNQINNVLAFPGIFRGALDVQAKDINESMKIAAAYALAELIPEEKLSADYIIPAVFDDRVVQVVAKAVAQAAIDSHVATKP